MQTTDAIENGVEQVLNTAHQVTASIHDQADDLQQRGQGVIDQEKERFSVIVDAGKTAVNGR